MEQEILNIVYDKYTQIIEQQKEEIVNLKEQLSKVKNREQEYKELLIRYRNQQQTLFKYYDKYGRLDDDTKRS